MGKVAFLVFCSVIGTFLVHNGTCRNFDKEDDDSIEIPTRRQSKSSNNGFSVFRPADDAIFNFINKLVNTTYLSSKMMLNRVRTQSEVRKQIEDQVEDFLESLPSVPIPILDDLGPVKSNVNVKETE